MAKKHGHHLPEYRNRGYLKYKKSSRSFHHPIKGAAKPTGSFMLLKL